jgi:prevent-host-death family protein
MAREVSVRELRNKTADVVAKVRSGERVVLTVNRRPVADIVPHVEERSPWVPAATLRRIVDQSGADPALLDDLMDVRSILVEDPGDGVG